MKHTAANTPFLAAAKRLFNKPIYARLLATMNGPGATESDREAACTTYLVSIKCQSTLAEINATLDSIASMDSARVCCAGTTFHSSDCRVVR